MYPVWSHHGDGAMEEVEDGRRVWCPCPLPRERMEDPPPRHRRHCHWSSVTSQQTLLSTGTMMTLSMSLQSFAASSFCLQTLPPDMSCTTCLWSSLKPLHRPLSCYKSQVMLQCCRSAGVQVSCSPHAALETIETKNLYSPTPLGSIDQVF